jgi:hypothetical protein
VINLQPTEGIEDVQGDNVQNTKVYKVIENDHVVIIRNGDRYSITGNKLQQ